MKVSAIGSNKTQVSLADGTEVLFSYSTPVAALVPGKGWMRTEPQKRLRQTLTFFDQMSRELALSLLRQGNNGSDILQILETITSDIEQENINDCAAHYASISAPTLTAIQF